MFLLGELLVAPGWLEPLFWQWLWLGPQWDEHSVPQADWHLAGTWVYPPYVAVSTMEAGSCGPCAGFVSIWNHTQCPQMSVLLWIFIVTNGGNDDPPCDTDVPMDIVQAEFLRCSGVWGCRRGCPSVEPLSLLAHLWGSWSDPYMTTPKWTYLQVNIALASSTFVIILFTLLIILDPTMTSTFLA